MKPEPVFTQGTTHRGFQAVSFEDEYGLPCSLQESSRAVCENEDGSVDDPLGWVWLGIDDAQPVILARDALKMGMELPKRTEFLNGQPTGWVPYPVPEEVPDAPKRGESTQAGRAPPALARHRQHHQAH